MNSLGKILCAVHRSPLAVALALCVNMVYAQEVQRGVMFGMGVANTYDTYLSPLEYRGPQVNFMRESMRRTHWKNISTQGLFTLAALYTSNKIDNADAMGGTLGYRQSWFYTWDCGTHWQLMAGGGAGAEMGFLYNMRNTANNPAQAQLGASLHAAASARYAWRWLSVRAQLEAPFMGLMFAPNYGQSYYEMFVQGNGDHNVVFTHPGNCPTLRALFTADINIRRSTLRLGYGADMVQSTPNNLRRHTYLHTAYIGFVRRFRILHN